MTLVVDASVALAWVLHEPEHRAEAERLAGYVGRASAAVPQIFYFEVHNVLLKEERQARRHRGRLAAQVAALARLGLTVDGDSFTRLETHTLPLARQHRLSVLDAAYLELATRRALPLATFDAGLRRAAMEATIPLA